MVPFQWSCLPPVQVAWSHEWSPLPSGGSRGRAPQHLRWKGNMEVIQFVNYMDVSENGGTPQSSILIGFSIINHPFWDTPIFGNTHMVNGSYLLKYREIISSPVRFGNIATEICHLLQEDSANSAKIRGPASISACEVKVLHLHWLVRSVHCRILASRKAGVRYDT